jgi:hypothetical protein
MMGIILGNLYQFIFAPVWYKIGNFCQEWMHMIMQSGHEVLVQVSDIGGIVVKIPTVYVDVLLSSGCQKSFSPRC